MSTFFQHIPVWVFPLLAWLLFYGVRQLRPREMPMSRALALPFAMILLAASRQLSVQMGALPFMSWLAGLVTTAVLCAWLAWPAGLEWTGDGRAVRLPGSVLPLVAMLAIFAARFAAGVLQARQPVLAMSPVVVMPVALVSGLASGIFFARLVAVLRLQLAPDVGADPSEHHHAQR